MCIKTTNRYSALTDRLTTHHAHRGGLKNKGIPTYLELIENFQDIIRSFRNLRQRTTSTKEDKHKPQTKDNRQKNKKKLKENKKVPHSHIYTYKHTHPHIQTTTHIHIGTLSLSLMHENFKQDSHQTWKEQIPVQLTGQLLDKEMPYPP